MTDIRYKKFYLLKGFHMDKVDLMIKEMLL